MFKKIKELFFSSETKDNVKSITIEKRIKKGENELKDPKSYPTLKFGERISMKCPDLGVEMTLRVSKWRVKVGQHVFPKQIICILENEEILIEYESITTAKVISLVELNTEVNPNEDLCVIEGI